MTSKGVCLELFCGTKSFSKVAEQKGYQTITLDNMKKFSPTFLVDIMACDDQFIDDFLLCFGSPYFVWASPPCTAYSKINRSMPNRTPDIEGSNAIVQRTLHIIKRLRPTHWMLENPETGLLKHQPFMNDIPYTTVAYCRYGAITKKETRLFGSKELIDAFSKIAMNCHKKLPEGQCEVKRRTNQHPASIGNSHHKEVSRMDRLRIPEPLIIAILDSINA